MSVSTENCIRYRLATLETHFPITTVIDTGEVCDKDMAPQHQLSDWSHMSGHPQRPVVSYIHRNWTV